MFDHTLTLSYTQTPKAKPTRCSMGPCSHRAVCVCAVTARYLLEVVEAVDHRGLGGGELGQHVQQLHHHILLVVDDGQVEGSGGGGQHTPHHHKSQPVDHAVW